MPDHFIVVDITFLELLPYLYKIKFAIQLHGRDLGIQGYIVKPFEYKEINDKILDAHKDNKK